MSKDAPKEKETGFLSSFIHKLKEKDRENREKEDRAAGLLPPQPSSAVPSPTASAGSASPGGPLASPSASPPPVLATAPDAQQAALVAASLSAKKSAPASGSTKEKFLGLFKSDAEKRAEKEAAAAAKAKAKEEAAAQAAAQAAALEPIKLELHCAEAGGQPMVGHAIRATAMRAPSAGAARAPLPIGVGSKGVCRWFRASAGSFDKILESVAPLYIPTVDDLDCRVCCQWVMEEDEAGAASAAAGSAADASTASAIADPASSSSRPSLQSSFAELGPIVMDPLLLQESVDVFAKGQARFLDLREVDTDAPVILVVKRTMLRILPAAGGEAKCAFLISKKAAAEPNGAPSSSVQLTLDSVDPLRFTLEDVASQKVFRGYFALEGDSLSQYAKARHQRDVMACLVRRILRTGSEALPASAASASVAANSSSAAAAASSDVPAGGSVDSSSSASPLLQLAVEPSAPGSQDLVRIVVSPVAIASSSASAAATVVSPTSELLSMLIPAPASTTEASSAPSVPPPSLVIPSQQPSTASASPLPSPAAAQVQSLSKRVSELTAEKNLFRENLNLIMVDKAKSEAESAALIASLQQQLQNKDSEMGALRKSLSQSGEDVDALKLAIQTLSTQMSTSANTEIRLAGEVRSLKNEKEALQREIKAAKEAAEERTMELEDANTRLQSEVRNATAANESLQTEYAALRAESARLRAADERCARLTESEANLRHDLGVFKAEMARYKDLQSKLDKVEMENHALRKQKERKHHAGASLESPATDSTPAAAPSPAHTDPAAESSSSTPAHSSMPTTPNGRDSTSPPHAAAAAADAAATAALSAALATLKEQHAQLQREHDALKNEHATLSSDLEASKSQLASVQSASDTSAASLADAMAQLASLTLAHEEIVANRNYYKRKCDSLSSSVDKMLSKVQADAVATPVAANPRTGLTPSSSSSKLASERSTHANGNNGAASSSASSSAVSEREVQKLRATVSSLRTECSDLQQTLQAYKKTLDSNYALLKFEREANLLLQSKGGSHGSAGGLFRSSKHAVLAQQFDSVRSLANSLSELVADKDLSIAHLKKSNLILSKRIHDLERRFESELEAAGDTQRWYGKIDMTELEREEGKARTEQAESRSRRNSIEAQHEQQPAAAASAASTAAEPSAR